MRRTHDHQRFETICLNAEAGHWQVIVPCRDIGDLMKVCKRLLDTKVRGWVGFGSSEHGYEEFVTATSDEDGLNSFQTFLRRVQHDLGLSVLVAEGFDLTLLLCDADTSVVRVPFGLSPRIEASTAGALVLSFVSQREADPAQWLEQLEKAYCEVRGHKRFRFDGYYE